MIEFNSVSWSPPGNSAILSDLTLNVLDGEFCCVVGPSGAGKTSLLRLAAGLITPTSGNIRLDGRLPAESRSQLSYVFQQPVLFPWRTVLENLRLPLEIKQIYKNDDKLYEYLELVNLKGSESLFPRELSGGMQSRVAIARALVTEPSILLMDEPFADLDEINREHLNLELQRIWLANRRTVMFVTHDLAEAVFLADRIIVLTNNPARVLMDIPVNLPRPRDERIFDEPVFDEILKQVRHALRLVVKMQLAAQDEESQPI